VATRIDLIRLDGAELRILTEPTPVRLFGITVEKAGEPPRFVNCAFNTSEAALKSVSDAITAAIDDATCLVSVVPVVAFQCHTRE